MSGKNYLKIRLTTQQLSFLISNILCKIIVNDLNNQNILKDIFEDKLQKRSKPKMMKKRKCWNKVGIFRIFKWTTDFLLWNSEQGTGEWLLLRKWFGTFFTSKWLFSWMSLRWVLRLPDSENDLRHSLQGRGRRVFFKWLLP